MELVKLHEFCRWQGPLVGLTATPTPQLLLPSTMWCCDTAENTTHILEICRPFHWHPYTGKHTYTCTDLRSFEVDAFGKAQRLQFRLFWLFCIKSLILVRIFCNTAKSFSRKCLKQSNSVPGRSRKRRKSSRWVFYDFKHCIFFWNIKGW